MDRKQGSATSRRPSFKARKRFFKGNRYTVENTTDFTSTSAKKLKKSEQLEVNVNPTFNYCIIEFSVIFLTLQQLLKCKDCDGAVTFSKNGQRGLGFKLSVKCKCKETFILSSPLIDKAFEINRRLVLALRMLGVGFEGMKNFCGIMDLGQGICNSTYYSIVDNIRIAAQAVAKIVFKKALEEEVKLNVEAGNPADELSVSDDGSWAKRRFTSLLGIVSLIGKYSNKILDIVVKSSICQGCASWKGQEDTLEYEAWYDEHNKDLCDANHTGSAGKMEVDGIVEMFQRSEELYNVKYANYIGDGDIKTFKALLDTKPYSDDFIVRCIGSNTQNNNESFNSCVWQLAPKHQFIGKKIIDIASYIAACMFNEGCAALLKIMETMGITIGPQAEQLARDRDAQ